MKLDPAAWVRPPIFDLVKMASGANEQDMYATFNMGIGMALVVAPLDADEVLAIANEFCPASVIGRVTDTPGIAIA